AASAVRRGGEGEAGEAYAGIDQERTARAAGAAAVRLGLAPGWHLGPPHPQPLSPEAGARGEGALSGSLRTRDGSSARGPGSPAPPRREGRRPCGRRTAGPAPPGSGYTRLSPRQSAGVTARVRTPPA